MELHEVADRSAHALVTEAFGDITINYTMWPIWVECFRILKPGAFALVLATGPQPIVISLDLRRVGFELRDTIGVYSAGTWTPCFVFRKPFVERTIAHQILATGTGALNIDACRVKHASAADLANHKAMVDALKAKGGSLGNSWKNSSDLANANEVKEGGRWPGNVVLVHAPGCQRVGETKVAAPVINRFDDGMKPFGHGAGHAFTSEQRGDAEGKETVAVYDCKPECPIQALDGQSGTTVASGGPIQQSGSSWKCAEQTGTYERICDSGGASRFFTQMECVPDCPVKGLDGQSGVTQSGAMKHEVPGYEGESATPFLRGWSGPSNQHGDSGGASRFFSQFETSPDLYRWLKSLALPPGSVLLDPYRGLVQDTVSEPVSSS